MKSMTGFGRAVADCESFSVTVDVSSVNKKGLETGIGLPRDWQPLERLVASKVRDYYTRGKVNVSCKVDFKSGRSMLSGNKAALTAAAEDLKAVCDSLGAKYELTPEILLKLNEQVGSTSAGNSDWEEAWKVLEPALDEAFKKSEQMRVLEGAALKSDLHTRLNLILEMALAVEKESKNTVGKYRDTLLERLKELGLELRLDDERLLKELCLFADKCDITEEITRLKSHIAQFIGTMAETDAVGRKMDFICQEMGREINTTASKANNVELTKLSISLKNELERIREQIQNIE